MDGKGRWEMHTILESENSQDLRQRREYRRNFVVLFAVYLTTLPVMQTRQVE
jgi:hypothetical protein